MTIAPASPQPRHHGRVCRRLVGEGRARGRRRQAGDIDIVLDRDRHAVKRQLGVFACRERARFREHLGLVAQADEQSRIAERADALEALRHRVFRCSPSRSMQVRYFSNRLCHALPA